MGVFITIITHIKDEAILLEYWLKHHITLVDKIIIIDYFSKDNSRNIISQYPSCEFRTTTNPLGGLDGGVGCDKEVMAIEETLSDWKISLNVTEFLIIDDLRSYTQTLEQQGLLGVRTSGMIIVDHLYGGDWTKWDQNKPLVQQFTHGYEEQGSWQKIGQGSRNIPEERNRLLHRAKNGNYHCGRHNTYLEDIQIDRNLFVAWFGTGFPKLKHHRNQNIKDSTGWSGHHKWSLNEINQQYIKELSISYSLPDRHPHYKKMLFHNAVSPKLPT